MQRQSEGNDNTIMSRYFLCLSAGVLQFMLQCGQKIKLISLKTPYFSGMACPVGVLAPAKIVNVTV
jgi:hypothetical protein